MIFLFCLCVSVVIEFLGMLACAMLHLKPQIQCKHATGGKDGSVLRCLQSKDKVTRL